ncbi:MAG: phospho-sugar mutase [Bacteroidales bacterium]
MATQNIDIEILDRANKWMSDVFDTDTRARVKYLIENDPNEITESFYRDLEFGTGGLRGIMGVGTNRMNKYTVGMATQGLANYLRKSFSDQLPVRVAIAYDSRNNSKYFAQISAEVLAANGCEVFLFDSLRPTPELSFAVRELKCHSGIVITASHNPKEYNGYKVYWNDGGQLVAPHDTNVVAEAQKISIEDVMFTSPSGKITSIGEDIDAAYEKRLQALSLTPESIKKHSKLKIVYTPIHGSGIMLVPRCLKAFGFENVHVVSEQATPDGNFPTVVSPNPEEKAAMSLALAKAKEINADLILATDPDADRVGVGLKDNQGNYILLNGNQAASLLIFYLLNQWKYKGKITGKEFIVKTIVTSELLKDMGTDFGVETFDVLTGFKFIAEIIRKLEGRKKFIGGGEESYGYLVGDFVRDKDAVISCCMFAEASAWAADQEKTLYEILIGIYVHYGFYVEKLISITKKGKSGAEEIVQMMMNYREQPPTEINGLQVVEIRDYQLQICFNMVSKVKTPILQPKSDVLQFFLAGGSKITVRPSGTEPKIKFYFGVKGKLESISKYSETEALMETQVEEIIEAMGLR